MQKNAETLKANEEFVKTYNDSKYPKPSVTVDMVIFGMFDREAMDDSNTPKKQLKVLLIQRGAAPFKGFYALPGGFVEMGETIEQAAERELREETNLQCSVLEPFGTYSAPDRDPRRWVISNGFMALVDASQAEVKAGDDASDAKWFDISFEEIEGEWHLALIHGEEKLEARLEEVSSPKHIKKRFRTIDSKEIAFDHELILADAMTQLQKWLADPHIMSRVLPESTSMRAINPTLQTILSRRSIRHFTETPVEPEKLDMILQAGAAAPSGRNLQTWRFTVLQSRRQIQNLKSRIVHVLEQTNEGYMYGFNEPDKLILVTGARDNHNTIRDGSCAMENMLLAAHSLGLGACWINSLRNCYDHPEIRAQLTAYGIPEDHLVVGMVVLGYPARAGKMREKRDDVIHYIDLE